MSPLENPFNNSKAKAIINEKAKPSVDALSENLQAVKKVLEIRLQDEDKSIPADMHRNFGLALKRAKEEFNKAIIVDKIDCSQLLKDIDECESLLTRITIS